MMEKVFSEKKKNPIYDPRSLELIKRLTQISYYRLILTCVPISELPSNISTMENEVFHTEKK